jgi:hypothetical protein
MVPQRAFSSLLYPDATPVSNNPLAIIHEAQILGDHLKAAIRYHFKTGHRETA